MPEKHGNLFRRAVERFCEFTSLAIVSMLRMWQVCLVNVANRIQTYKGIENTTHNSKNNHWYIFVFILPRVRVIKIHANDLDIFSFAFVIFSLFFSLFNNNKRWTKKRENAILIKVINVKWGDTLNINQSFRMQFQ